MLTALKLLPVGIKQQTTEHQLRRRPERFAAMTEDEAVKQYPALESNLIIPYAACLKLIYRARRKRGRYALDLCCGPGHFSCLVAKYLGYEKVIGVDLSPGMIDEAKEKADQLGVSDRVEFVCGNALDAGCFGNDFDLVTCNDALHHMNGSDSTSEKFGSLSRQEQDSANEAALNQAKRLFEAAEAGCRDDGVALLMDLVRLKSRQLTRRYTRIVGQAYWRKGWKRFYREFSRSMRAAWTEEEVSRMVPDDDLVGAWEQMSQTPVPTTQMVLRVPQDNQGFFIRSGSPWGLLNHPVPASKWIDWSMFNVTLGMRGAKKEPSAITEGSLGLRRSCAN